MPNEKLPALKMRRKFLFGRVSDAALQRPLLPSMVCGMEGLLLFRWTTFMLFRLKLMPNEKLPALKMRRKFLFGRVSGAVLQRPLLPSGVCGMEGLLLFRWTTFILFRLKLMPNEKLPALKMRRKFLFGRVSGAALQRPLLPSVVCGLGIF